MPSELVDQGEEEAPDSPDLLKECIGDLSPRERFPLSRTVFIEIVQVLEWSTESSRELKHAAPDFVFIAPCESEYEGSFPTMIHRKH